MTGIDPSYASAGVNIARAEAFVERLKKVAMRPGHSRLWQGAGGYAVVFQVSDHQGIALTTDGVGTKLLVACQLNRHDTIGIDLVAMCANDLICVGARPTVFLDYYATGRLDDAQSDAIISGIVSGCDRADMILAGGETAEMPDLYEHGHYDLAGFAVGEVSRERLLTGESIAPGQKLVGVASGGIHSNGLSLARKVLAHDRTLMEQLLEPTLIYVSPVNRLLDEAGSRITGISHITGGGWRNILRLQESVGYHIQNPLPVPSIFAELGKVVPAGEMYATFNMGMGLCVVVEQDTAPVIDAFNSTGFKAQEIGYVTDKARRLTIEGSPVVIQD